MVFSVSEIHNAGRIHTTASLKRDRLHCGSARRANPDAPEYQVQARVKSGSWHDPTQSIPQSPDKPQYEPGCSNAQSSDGAQSSSSDLRRTGSAALPPFKVNFAAPPTKRRLALFLRPGAGGESAHRRASSAADTGSSQPPRVAKVASWCLLRGRSEMAA